MLKERNDLKNKNEEVGRKTGKKEQEWREREGEEVKTKEKFHCGGVFTILLEKLNGLKS